MFVTVLTILMYSCVLLVLTVLADGLEGLEALNAQAPRSHHRPDHPKGSRRCEAYAWSLVPVRAKAQETRAAADGGLRKPRAGWCKNLKIRTTHHPRADLGGRPPFAPFCRAAAALTADVARPACRAI